MLLRKYETYDEYVRLQCEAAVRKRKYIWAQEDVLKLLSKQVRKLNIDKPFGICHGVRNGFEVDFLRKELADISADVIGTEISDEVSKENEFTICWDFHEVKPEWIGKVDFIYSNSFDHSYKPAECIAAWMSCISPKGACFLEWTNTHNAGKTGDVDCFQSSLDEYLELTGEFDVHVVCVDGARNQINATKTTRLIVISHPDGETE
jgi:hypothetical protein